MRKIIPLTIYLACLTAFCQNVYTKTLWDKNCNCPVEFATISNNEGYSISNEDGLFNFITNDVNAEINMLGYKKLNFKLNEIKNDTIYLKEFPLEKLELEKRPFGNTRITAPSSACWRGYKAVWRKNVS